MMNRSRLAGTVVVAAAATALACGTAQATPADPVPPTPNSVVPIAVPVAPGVNYYAQGGDAALQTPWGTVSVSPGLQVAVQDERGNTVLGEPNNAGGNLDAAQPITATAGVPGVHPADADAVPTIDPVTKFETALATFSLNVGTAVTVGAMVGGVGGAALGCVIPGLAGAAVALVGAIPACIIGAATVGGLGAVIGGAALGIPVAIVSGVQMAQTLSQ